MSSPGARTRRRPGSRTRGFTLVELLVAVAIVAVILMLAAPSFQDYILRQRLKGIHAQLVTDLAFARSHAVATGTVARIVFRSASDGTSTCYSIYVVRPVANHKTIRCDCRLAAGSRCPTHAIEARTVQLPSSLGISIAPATAVPDGIGFDPVDGTISTVPADDFWRPLEQFVVDTKADASRTLRTTIIRSGRTSVCATGDGLGAARC